jgi:hypothetical protein
MAEGNGTSGNGTKLLDTDLVETDGLSDEQRDFVARFLRTGSATQAAQAVGLKWPRVCGPRMLQVVAVSGPDRRQERPGTDCHDLYGALRPDHLLAQARRIRHTVTGNDDEAQAQTSHKASHTLPEDRDTIHHNSRREQVA